MTLGSKGIRLTGGGNSKKPISRIYKFELLEDEFAELLTGKKIILETGNTEYKRAKFILKFKGTKI